MIEMEWSMWSGTSDSFSVKSVDVVFDEISTDIVGWTGIIEIVMFLDWIIEMNRPSSIIMDSLLVNRQVEIWIVILLCIIDSSFLWWWNSMIINSSWFNSVIQSGNAHYSVDHYSEAEWFYWRWNQRICWFRCGRNSLWAVLNPVVQYSGGDDSILYGTDGIRWFYSIVHVSSISKWLEYCSDW